MFKKIIALIKNNSDLFRDLIITAICSFILFGVVLCPTVVIGESMQPTLQDGNFLIGYRLSRTYEQGDIVAIKINEKMNYIKRVIGTPGDTVEINYAEQTVTVNGEIIDEPYLNEVMLFAGDPVTEYTVPDNCYFVMGDNRNHSADSRDPNVGMINKSQIIGKMWFSIIPPDFTL